MLEVVFQSSVEGAVKYAQRCGNRTRSISAVGSVYAEAEKAQSPQEEAQMQRQAEEEMKHRRERAVSLGGTPQDVFCFPLGLSMGDISGDGCSQRRKESISKLSALFPSEQPYHLEEIDKAAAALSRLTVRAGQGEPVRVWYSNQPDDICGMLWFLSQLEHRVPKLPPIHLLKLPEAVQAGDTIQVYCGWGEVLPEDFHSFLTLAKKVSPSFVRYASMEWRRLQEEQMPLRAVINGRVQSVPEYFYDSFLEQELMGMETEFSEAALIGMVMGRYQLGIGDLWIARRVEAMIEAGRLCPVTEPAPGELLYRRRLRKC